MRNASRLKLGALLFAAIAAAGGVNAQEKKQISIATSSSSIPAGAARIAREMGLFEKYGIEAKVTPMDTGAVATAGLLSGTIDFATSGPSDVVMAQANGQDVVALSSGYSGFAANIVLSKAVVDKKGLSASASITERLKALDGLTIASTSAGSTFTVALKASTEGVGAKINVVYMGQPAMVAAMQRGAVDGFVVSAPYYALPIANGSAVMWISGPKGEFPSAPKHSVVVMAKRSFVEANPELTKRIKAVFADFSKAMDERPADVKAAMKKLWPDLDEATLNAVYAQETKSFKFEPLKAEEMAHEIAFMKLGSVPLPKADSLVPAKMLFP